MKNRKIMKPITQKGFKAAQIITFMNYTVGNCDIDLDAEVIIPENLKHKHVEGESVKTWLNWFLDRRSKMRHLRPQLKQWQMNKSELINYFIDQTRSARSRIIEADPIMFFVLPQDLKILDLHSFRELGAFNPVGWFSFELGGTINYPVFEMRDVLEVYSEVILGIAKPEPGSLVLGNQELVFDAVLSPNSATLKQWKPT